MKDEVKKSTRIIRSALRFEVAKLIKIFFRKWQKHAVFTSLFLTIFVVILPFIALAIVDEIKMPPNAERSFYMLFGLGYSILLFNTDRIITAYHRIPTSEMSKEGQKNPKEENDNPRENKPYDVAHINDDEIHH